MVYVDNMQAPFGRMVMCHMMADTTAELLAMAEKIGLDPKWIQAQGTPKEHFDVSKSRRVLALNHGAKVISGHDMVMLLQKKAGK